MKKLISIIVLLAMLTCAVVLALPAAAEVSESGDYAFLIPPVKKSPLWNELLTLDGLKKIDYPFESEVDYMLHGGTLEEVKSGIFSYADYPEELDEFFDTFDLHDNFVSFLEDSPHGFGTGFSTTRSDADDYDINYDIMILGNDANTFSVNLCVVSGMFNPNAQDPFKLPFREDGITNKEEVAYDTITDELIESLKKYKEGYYVEGEYMEREFDLENMVFSEAGGAYIDEDGVHHCIFVRKLFNGELAVVYYDVLPDKDFDLYEAQIVNLDGFYPTITEPCGTEKSDDTGETDPSLFGDGDITGTGSTEPVVAPKTVDRLALIAGVFVISLAICAAAFTVVKEKKR